MICEIDWKVKVVEDDDQEEVLELKLFDGGNSTKAFKSFKQLALTQTKFVQQVSVTCLGLFEIGDFLLDINVSYVMNSKFNFVNIFRSIQI